MSGENTIKCLEDVNSFLERVFAKLLEDIEEAYHRTPLHISSRPYLERAYRLIRAGLEAVIEHRYCVSSKQREKQ